MILLLSSRSKIRKIKVKVDLGRTTPKGNRENLQLWRLTATQIQIYLNFQQSEFDLLIKQIKCEYLFTIFPQH